MAKFKKKGGKETPEVSTAALPDIIFIILFFFMVVTVMRETEIKVDNQLPKATELTELKRKTLVSHVYIGKPKVKYIPVYGSAARIQLNDEIVVNESAIANFIEEERKARTQDEIPLLTTSLRCDVEVEMGLVGDVKQELRKVNALKLNYAAVKGK